MDTGKYEVTTLTQSRNYLLPIVSNYNNMQFIPAITSFSQADFLTVTRNPDCIVSLIVT